MMNYAYVDVPVPLNEDFVYSFDPQKQNVTAGVRVMVPFGNRNIRGYVVRVDTEEPETSFEIKSISRVIDKSPVFWPDQYRLALWMEKFYFAHRGQILDTMVPGGKRDTDLSFLDTQEPENEKSIVLTPSQKNAIDSILSGSQSLYYLFGITGSGKTEVFLSCAESVIAKGGQVIYLVPEITLTHQLARLVSKRFHNKVAILHSAMTDSQRITEWRRIKSGEVSLAIGARSAVFAPFENLQMIIMDEEHETSYKSSNDPRYHARQVAQKRISDCNGKLVMGSATPSLEAWNLMKDPSRMLRLDLTERVGGGKLPMITVADMSKEKGIIGSVLLEKMHRSLSESKQVILFLNRRGFSYYFHCKSCGFELKCPHCDVPLTYHKAKRLVVCHYCSYETKPVTVCPSCHSLDVMYSGFGTEQVEAELRRLFPLNTVARIDTDTASDRKAVKKTLDDFRNGDIDILLGTQMVAKGLNFPNVNLVGAVMPDNGLLIPDFRSEERVFSLLVQVSGRSGRADGDGQVVIQTRMPDSPAIRAASEVRVSEFFDNELEIRRNTGFPPFSRMINITCRSRNRENALSCAQEIADLIRAQKRDVQVFGAQECPIEKIRENWRFQVLVRSTDASQMMEAVHLAMGSYKALSSVYVELDVDPLDLI